MKKLKNKWVIGFLVIIILSIIIGGFIYRASFNLDYVTEGQLGDSFGIVNPFIAIAAAFLTFAAFWVQYQANQKRIEENNEQKKKEEKQAVVARFYEMLKIHKDNVQELEWDDNGIRYSGRMIFDAYLKSFDAIFEIIVNDLNERKINKGMDFVIKESYKAFFDGFSENQKTDVFGIALMSAKEKRGVWTDPFFINSQGCRYELNHYYRHLFLMVKQVVNTDDKILSYNEKRDLLRILRAQLTSKEQAMLFYNWYSGYGIQWEEIDDSNEVKNSKNHFFTDYRMLHNINFNDFCFLPTENKIDVFKNDYFVKK